MACSSWGNNIIIIAADTAVAAFETIVPALELEGVLSTAEGQALENYAQLATSTIETIITEIKSGTSTLPKIAALLQTVVDAYNKLSGSLPPDLTKWVNVANVTLQALLATIEAEIGTTKPAVSVEPIHPGFLENHKLDGYRGRLEKVNKNLAAAVALKTKVPA